MRSRSRLGLDGLRQDGNAQTGDQAVWLFGPDLDRDRGVWSGPDRVPIGPGLNFPNTNCSQSDLNIWLWSHMMAPETHKGVFIHTVWDIFVIVFWPYT